MKQIDKVKDAAFLRELDLDNLKTYFVKIIILTFDETPIREIEGRVSGGSITIDGSSSVRRAGSISFVAESADNDLTDIDNLLSINKKIKILIGLENHINTVDYDDIIWFQQGIFLITQPSITHNTSGVIVNLQFKDKMCLLNGDLGGNLPTSVTFDSYDQYLQFLSVDALPLTPKNTYIYYLTTDNNYYMWDAVDGWTTVDASAYEDESTRYTSIPQSMFDIIQTLVCNYGGEAISNICINDIERESKFSVRYIGDDTLYYNTETGEYKYDITESEASVCRTFDYNQDCGYIYDDFTYPGTSLTSSIGDNVCTVLDKIVSALGNYEYFYDVNGMFVFQEKKNYLNTSYDPVQKWSTGDLLSTGGNLLNNGNYYVDFSNSGESVYNFEEGSVLINSYTNTPNYLDIKNDYHIWGTITNGSVIHYHIAIKEKPKKTYKDPATGEYTYNHYTVYYLYGDDGEPNGKVSLEKDETLAKYYGYADNTVTTTTAAASMATATVQLVSTATASFNNTTSTLSLKSGDFLTPHDYVPTDWRAELYMQGLVKKHNGLRPDIYEQELLDLFDGIYNMKDNTFKADIVDNPNDLTYWFDYLDPIGDLQNISVDAIGSKIYSYQQDNIKKLYNTDIPDRILVNRNNTQISISAIVQKCIKKGQNFSYVDGTVYESTSIGTAGYVAQEIARNVMYQYTDYNSTISISCVPIYYLEPNTRITVNDRASGIHGDFVIKSISLPLDGESTMTISATKALQRV